MTLYYTLVFGILMLEMGIFVSLIIPMPHSVKRRLFNFISESPLVARFQYAMKITFIFILILFVDSVNRVYSVQVELARTKQGNAQAALEGSGRMEVQARKFYSQRNMYLCGFTLFLSLILNRTYVMILETLRLEEKLAQIEGTSKGGKESTKLMSAGNAGEIGQLKKDLAQRDSDIAALKKQCEGLSREYNRLGDEVAGKDAVPKKNR